MAAPTLAAQTAQEREGQGSTRLGDDAARDLLKRYLRMYWLKPFDALADTANAWALRQFSWEAPILEIGGGDGVFSFIMHGGEFAPADDRFDQTDPGRTGDIYDVYRPQQPLTVRRLAGRTYRAGLDLKTSHLLKCQETRLYESLLLGEPAPLPFAPASFRTVFLYFPHGLVERGARLDYPRTLAEIRRVIRADGTLLMTAMNHTIVNYFTCHRVAERLARCGLQRGAAYFGKLDGGRFAEIGTLGRSLEQWRAVLAGAGFRLVDVWTHVTPFAWRVYDVQTRPVLRPLIRSARFFRRIGLKGFVKAIWIAGWLPCLSFFYSKFAKPRRLYPGASDDGHLLFVFRAVPEDACS